jgi:hypothetical protein
LPRGAEFADLTKKKKGLVPARKIRKKEDRDDNLISN